MKNHKNKDAMEDFRMRYSILIDDIKYIKSRQWAVTYYLLLLYAAIISFYRLIDSPQLSTFCNYKNILFTISFLIAILGTAYLCNFQSRMKRYRTLLLSVLDYLSEEFREFEKKAIKERRKHIKGYISWFNGFFLFTLPFILMLWFGFLFIYWYFFRIKVNTG